MDVSCDAGFPVAGYRWKWRGRVYATVVCKATFAIEPVLSPRAREQEPLRGGALDELAASLEGSPFKVKGDLVVVGSVYARDGVPTTRLLARVLVGDVDKSLVVHGNRVRRPDGRVTDAAAFTRASIGWELAAGGPDSWNTSGLGSHLRDAFGAYPMPRIVAPGADESEVAVGFGPIPPESARRRAHAGTRRIAVVDDDLVVFPDDLEPRFFQAAPDDQQTGSPFALDQQIVLEGLHPEKPRLTTNLTPMQMTATFVSDRRRDVHPLVADALCIDTDAMRATLLLRAFIEVAAGEVLRAHVDADGEAVPPSETNEGRQATLSSLAAAEELPGMSTLSLPEAAGRGGPGRDDPTLPFGPGGSRAAASRAEVAPTFSRSKAMTARHDVEGQPAPEVPLLPFRPSAAPPGVEPLAQARPSSTPSRPSAPPLGPPPPASPVPSAPPPAPPLRPPPVPSPRVVPGPVAPGPVAPAPVAPAPRHEVPSAIAAVRPERVREAAPPIDRPAVRPVSPLDSLDASNRAAVGGDVAAAARRPPREPRGTTHDSTEAAAQTPTELLNLLWFDPTLARRLRESPTFHEIVTPRGRRDVREAVATAADEAEHRREAATRRDVVRALAVGAVIDPGGFERCYADAADVSGAVQAPLLVVRGDLVMRWDERDALRATLGIAAPFAALDKALAETTEAAAAVVANEWSVAASIEVAIKRVREALARTARDLAPPAVDAAVQRALLERRRMKSATLLGVEWLRAELAVERTNPVPLYLPAELRNELPLLERFPIRAVAELRRRQDSAEAHPDALFVLALARRVGPVVR